MSLDKPIVSRSSRGGYPSGSVLGLHARGIDTRLSLILTTPVSIGSLALLITFEEEDLCKAFIRIHTGREWRCVGDFQSDVTFPLRLKGRHIDNDSAASVSRFSKAYRENRSWDLEVLNTSGERE